MREYIHPEDRVTRIGADQVPSNRALMIGFDYTDVEAARAVGVAYVDCDALYSAARRLDADDADDVVEAQLAIVWPPAR